MSDRPKILIVDDEPNVLFVLERTLQKGKYIVETALTGREAIDKLNGDIYDLLLLDLQMQPVGGMEVLQAARLRDPDTVAIILTAHGTIETAVEALRFGAFDYLFKPAPPETIRQRVREGLKQRRQLRNRTHVFNQINTLRSTLMELQTDNGQTQQSQIPNQLSTAEELVVDQQHRVARLGGRLLNLTTAEFDLLACLVRQAPKPVSPRQLVNQALEYDLDDAEAREIIKYHIHHLRKKIERDLLHPYFIRTVRYKGYFWGG